MRFLFLILLMGVTFNCYAEGRARAVASRLVEDIATDLRVIGVLREVSANPVGIAVLRKISDGSTLYLKEGATYKGVKLMRVERGRVVLGLDASSMQIQPISEADEIASEDSEDMPDSDETVSKDGLAEETWVEIDSIAGAKSKKEKTEVSSVDTVFELNENKGVKASSDNNSEDESE